MKTIRNIIACLLTISAVSCSKNIIELTPDSELTTAQYYKTAKDIDLAVLGIYSAYQSRKQTDYVLLELPSDNLYRSTYTLSAGSEDADNLSITAANPLFNTFWTTSYNGIARANAVLDNIDNPIDYKAGQKEQLSGEAKFLRALYYFDLVRMFGDVPEVTTTLSVSEAQSTPRAPANAIYDLIVSDLKEAVASLPSRAAMAKGRTNSAAAAALLGKVYVYRKDWGNAKTYLEMVAAQGNKLVPSFANIWKLETEDNDEMVFAVKYTEGTNGQSLSSAFLPFGGKTGIATSGNESVFPSWDIHKLFDAADTRKTTSISEYYKAPTPANAPLNWFPHVSKYEVKHVINSSGLDLPVIRYADVVLLLSEAYYGLNDKAQALTQLNKIRERAFGNTTYNYVAGDIVTTENFTDKILLERRLEFAFENERWFDLVRFGKLQTELTFEERGYNQATQTALKVTLQPKDNYKLFPIPQSQIDVYPKDGLSQNSGY